MDKNYEKEYKQRARELISQLTLDEKLSMLTTHHAAVERLGLGEYYIGTEVARGYVGRDKEHVSTVFPQPVGLASTFDKDLMEKLGEIAGDEARAYYNPDKRGGAALWGPTVDMARDPRWGRNEEAYGEDVCLTGEMSAAYTRGMAGDNGRFLKTIPTLKHFCADNNEENRASCDAYLPLRLKYDYYYAAFENAIVNGGAKSIMTAYNEINGCPAILNTEVQTVLKDKWGLWYTVSDGGDFSQTVAAHRFVDTHSESLALSLKAGSDSMTDNGILVKAAAEEALREGRLTEEDIDRTLLCTLFSRFALGQFDDCEYNNIDKAVIDSEAHREVNLRAAREQVTLLKNTGILPLVTAPRKIAVVGALADENLPDWYTGVSSFDMSVLEGMKAEFPESEIVYDSLWDHVAIKASNGKYLSITPDGILTASAETAGENEIFELQDWGENWKNLFSVKHKRYVRLYDDSTFKLHNRIVYEWFTRETLNFKEICGKYVIEEFLHHRRMYINENGEVSVKHASGSTAEQLFEIELISSGRERAAELGEYCDFVLYCVGNHPSQVAKECHDRKTLALNIQSGMAAVIYEHNPKTVMAIISSYPYSINEEAELLPAIIYSSHAGMYLGPAVAETLSGKNNPAARTPQTWYRSEHDLPNILNYDIETAGSTYMYFKGKPIFPFGHGLSYSKFEYSDFAVERTDGGFAATLRVKNTSNRDGDEVVQIYFSVNGSEIVRPIKKLCAFERLHIKAGKTEFVSIPIPRRILEIYDVRTGNNILESGEYLFMAAASSEDIRQKTAINVEGESIGKRPYEFAAESFDYGKEVRIKYSKVRGHFLIGAGWASEVRYDGVQLEGKTKLTVWACSTGGRGRITLRFGETSVEISVEPSNSRDDFKPYIIDIPDSKAETIAMSLQEGTAVLKFVIE